LVVQPAGIFRTVFLAICLVSLAVSLCLTIANLVRQD
jgi:hypothetical protein